MMKVAPFDTKRSLQPAPGLLQRRQVVLPPPPQGWRRRKRLRQEKRQPTQNHPRHVSVEWQRPTTLCVLLCLLLWCGCSLTDAASSPPLLPQHAVPTQPRKTPPPRTTASSSNSTTTIRDIHNDDKKNSPIHPIHTEPLSQKEKKKKKASSATLNPQKTKHQRPTTAQTASLRRLQHEWKEAIQAGIAFDWIHGEPIVSPGRRHKKKKKTHNADILELDSHRTRTRTTTPKQQSSSHIWIGPLHPRNLWVWHFTITGLPGSVYEQGVYHGRLVLPRNYPDQPPRVQVWTKSGRFLIHHNICLSASHYHPETWNPSQWSCRTVIESLRLHMCTPANEIGGCQASYQERLDYATSSRQYCGRVPMMTSKKKKRKAILVVVDHARMIQRGFLPPTATSAGQRSEEESELTTGAHDDAKRVNDPAAATTKGDTTTTKESSSTAEQNTEQHTTARYADAHNDFAASAAIQTRKPRSKSKTKTTKRKRRSPHISKTKGTKVVKRQSPQQQTSAVSTATTRVTVTRVLKKALLRMGLLAFVLLFCVLNR